MAPTVLIVDDHGPFRSFARALLDANGFDVVGEAADGASAVEAVTLLRPDVVLLDIQLPDVDGFSVAEQLSQERNSPKVVLISTREASSYRRRLGAVAACGFIPKSELSGEALAALLV
jgi:two-component system nitrate/nitrite response regulator NarL